MKTVLVLGGGSYYVRAIERVRAAGYRTVVVDRDAAAPGLAIADAAHAVDLADPDAVLGVARRHGVDAVLPLNDFGVRSAARVADELGLRGLTPESAELACDKGLMRERWARDGLPGPPFRVATTWEQAEVAAERVGLPLVVKPADSGGGGRGVSVVRDRDELRWAWDFAHPFARNGRVVVEGYVEGTELTVETISRAGQVHVLAVSDKVKPPLRTRVATSLHYPAALDEATLAAVESLAHKAVLSIGIEDGPAHLELIVGDDGPRLLELGARGGGGHVFSTIVEATSGVDMVRESVRVLAGDEPDLRITRRDGCVYRLFVPTDGVVRAIHGVDEARELPGVIDVGVTRKPGDVLGGLLDSLQRSGFAVVSGCDREEAIARADAVERTIVFELDPLTESHA
jgi:biotin carboxylase